MSLFSSCEVNNNIANMLKKSTKLSKNVDNLPILLITRHIHLTYSIKNNHSVLSVISMEHTALRIQNKSLKEPHSSQKSLKIDNGTNYGPKGLEWTKNTMKWAIFDKYFSI